MSEISNVTEIPTTVIHLVRSSNDAIYGDCDNDINDNNTDDLTTITPVEGVLLEDLNGNTFRVIDSEHFNRETTKYYLINICDTVDNDNIDKNDNNNNDDDNDDVNVDDDDSATIICNMDDCKNFISDNCVDRNIMLSSVGHELRQSTIIHGNTIQIQSESGVCMFM